MVKAKQWTEYIVRCRRWVRDPAGKKVWQTVDLPAATEQQALDFYHDLQKGNSALEDPEIIVRTVTEHPYNNGVFKT
jgi:hypothetical protein